MRTRRTLLPLSLVAVPALALAGCASADAGASSTGGGDDAAFRIVTSTTVYADLVSQVVGDAAEVEAVIDSAAQDPHDYEATARDGLTVQDADLVVMNGGGYDQFMVDLVESAGVEHVLQAVEFSHDYPGAEGHDHDHEADDAHDHDGAEEHDDAAEDAEEAHEHEGDDVAHEHDDDTAHDDATDAHEHDDAEEAHDHDHDHGHDGHGHIHGFNEHVWYDPHTMIHFVEGLEGELNDLLPDARNQLAEGSAALVADLEALEGRLGEIANDHEGETVFFTEPVGGYFAAAAGLTDVTAEGFAEAVEHGEDVAPAILNDALQAIEGGDVTVLVANAQTGGAETELVIEAADEAGLPVVEFTETVPDGQTYIEWMTDNAEALAAALA